VRGIALALDLDAVERIADPRQVVGVEQDVGGADILLETAELGGSPNFRCIVLFLG
jgi:hypothetical protein